MGLPLLFQFIKVLFECIQIATPKPAIGFKPGFEFSQRGRVNAVQAPLTIRFHNDQTRIPKHPEVFRNHRLTHAALIHQGVYRLGTV
jgi:hypothetical protein